MVAVCHAVQVRKSEGESAEYRSALPDCSRELIGPSSVRRHLNHAAIHAERNSQVDRRASVGPLQDGLVADLRCAGRLAKLCDSIRLGRYAGDQLRDPIETWSRRA